MQVFKIKFLFRQRFHTCIYEGRYENSETDIDINLIVLIKL